MEILKYPIGQFNLPETIDKSKRNEWIKSIERLPESLKTAAEGWSDEQFNTPYREGSWTVKQLIHHIADSHMNSLIRFKWGLTEDSPTIKTYDQSAWANLQDVRILDAKVSLDLISALHLRFVALLKNMSLEDFSRTIFHPEMKKHISLEQLLALYGWHSEHHLAQILQLKKLQELYHKK